MLSFEIGDRKIIARVDNAVAGYLDFDVETPKAASDSVRENLMVRNLCINMIYVNPAHRRQGIADGMLDTFLDYAGSLVPAIVWVSLWTGRDIEVQEGLGLYKKHGFRLMAYHADYYEPGIGTSYFAMRLN